MELDYSGYRYWGQGRWKVHANWLVFMENGLECAHCPTVHPSFTKDYDIWPEWFERGRCVGHLYRRKDGGTPFRILNAFPNAMLWTDGTSALAAAVVPLGPETCEMVGDIWVAEDLTEAEARAAAGGIDELLKEDLEPMARQQAGARSAVIADGQLLPDRERGISRWHRLLAEAVLNDSSR